MQGTGTSGRQGAGRTLTEKKRKRGTKRIYSVGGWKVDAETGKRRKAASRKGSEQETGIYR